MKGHNNGLGFQRSAPINIRSAAAHQRERFYSEPVQQDDSVSLTYVPGGIFDMDRFNHQERPRISECPIAAKQSAATETDLKQAIVQSNTDLNGVQPEQKPLPTQTHSVDSAHPHLQIEAKKTKRTPEITFGFTVGAKDKAHQGSVRKPDDSGASASGSLRATVASSVFARLSKRDTPLLKVNFLDTTYYLHQLYRADLKAGEYSVGIHKAMTLVEKTRRSVVNTIVEAKDLLHETIRKYLSELPQKEVHYFSFDTASLGFGFCIQAEVSPEAEQSIKLDEVLSDLTHVSPSVTVNFDAKSMGSSEEGGHLLQMPSPNAQGSKSTVSPRT